MRPVINIAPTRFHPDYFTKGGHLGTLLGETLYPVGQVFLGFAILSSLWLIVIIVLQNMYTLRFDLGH